MERFGDDLLGHILEGVLKGPKVLRDPARRSFSEVCKQWKRVEAMTRASLTVSYLDRLPNLLARFPNITTLTAAEKISDYYMEHVVRMCPNLQTLDLDSSLAIESEDFGDDTLCAIANGCRQLTTISLGNRRNITDIGVIALIKNAKKLASIDLSECDITDKSLEAVSDMTSLTTLYLNECTLITDYGFVCLANGSPAKTLRALSVSCCPHITDEGLAHVGKMSSLHDLTLKSEGYHISDVTGYAISNISTLRRLNLMWQLGISDITLFSVSQKCKNLVEVDLSGCLGITGDGICCFATHKSLKVLHIPYTDLGVGDSADDIVFLVSNCQSLKHLVLDRTLKDNMPTAVKEKIRGSCRIHWGWLSSGQYPQL